MTDFHGRCYEIRRELLGLGHPSTRRALQSLLATQNAQWNFDEQNGQLPDEHDEHDEEEDVGEVGTIITEH